MYGEQCRQMHVFCVFSTRIFIYVGANLIYLNVLMQIIMKSHAFDVRLSQTPKRINTLLDLR